MPFPTPYAQAPYGRWPLDEEERKKRSYLDDLLDPGAEEFNKFPDMKMPQGALFEDPELRGPRRLPPEVHKFALDNPSAILPENISYKPRQPSADGGADGADSGSGPGLPSKDPWEMTPEELGVKPQAPTKDPWEANDEELGIAPKIESEVPSGTRGAPPKYKMSDRSSVYGRANRAGIGVEGISAAARFNLTNALGAIGDPAQELEIVRRAIEKDLGVDYPIENVRMGPATRQLEWVDPKTGKWDLVRGAGAASFFKDVSAALPELRELAYEGGGGVAAGALGTVVGSFASPATGIGVGAVSNAAGAAGGAFYARLTRLQYAKEQGMTDMSDDEIYQNAFKHALWAGGGTLGAAAILKITSVIWKLARGSPVELLDAYQHNLKLAEGKPLAQQMDDRVMRALEGTAEEGRGFPVTAGQQSALTEVLGPTAGHVARDISTDEGLLAERITMGFRNPSKDLREIYTRQFESGDAVDAATFPFRDGDRAASTAGRVLQGAMHTAREQELARGRAAMEPAIRGQRLTEKMMESASKRPIEDVATDLRTLQAKARDDLFEPFKRQYDKLEADSKSMVDLGPLRANTRAVEKKYGQDIVKYLDSTDIPEVKEMLNAGLAKFLHGNLPVVKNMPVPIGQLEKLRKELTAAIGQLEKSTSRQAPRAGQVLVELRDGIDASYQRSLQPEMLTMMHNLRQGFAQAMNQFDRGIIGKITNKDSSGAFTMSGTDVVEYLMSDPANARAFVSALKTSNHFVNGKLVPAVQPELAQALGAAQEGVLTYLTRNFKNQLTGEWDNKGFEKWVNNHVEAADALFALRPNAKNGLDPGTSIVRKIGEQMKRFREEAEGLEKRMATQSKYFEERFGVFTADPAILVKTLISEGRVQDLRRAQVLVGSVAGPEGMMKFRNGLSQVVRSDILDSSGKIDPGKVQSFLTSENGRVVGSILGDKWVKNVELLGDIMKIRNLQASGIAPRDLASQFNRGVPELRGIWRFLRVIAAPMTREGRGLTGAVGLMNEKTQQKLGDIMADPEKLEKLLKMRFSKFDPLTKAGKIQLGKVGLEHVGDFWDMAKNLYGFTADRFGEDPVDEKAGMQEWNTIGQPRPDLDIPTGGQVPGNIPSFERGVEGQGQGLSPIKNESRYGEDFPTGLNPVPGDRFGPLSPLRPQGKVRGSSAIATERGANRPQDSLRLDDTGMGLMGLPDEQARIPIPGSYSGAMDMLAQGEGMPGGKRFITKFGDEDYTGRESSNMRWATHPGDDGQEYWNTLEQGQQTSVPKGIRERQDPLKLDDGLKELFTGAPARMQKRWNDLVGFSEKAGADGKMGQEELDKRVSYAREFVDDALKSDPATKILNDLKPRVDKIVNAMGGAATAIGSHLMHTLETAVSSTDRDAQHRAVTELVLMITGVGGSTRARTIKEGIELGSAGGGLPPIKPPARTSGPAETRGRMETIPGGPEVVKEHIDQLSVKLSDALKEAHEAVKSGKGDIPSQVKGVRKHISALERESEGLMKQAEGLGPPLSPFNKWQLKGQGRSPHDYRLELLDELNAEIDMGKREAFRLMATGKDVKKPTTVDNIKDWMDAAGVENVTVTTEKDGSRYLKFPDPNSKGVGKSVIRESDHPVGKMAFQQARDILDVSSARVKSGGNRMKDIKENVSGESYSEWENVIAALKFRLSKSPDGQWLISPDKAPRPGNFRRPIRMEKAKQSEWEQSQAGRSTPIGDRQLEFNFGRNPFDDLIE